MKFFTKMLDHFCVKPRSFAEPQYVFPSGDHTRLRDLDEPSELDEDEEDELRWDADEALEERIAALAAPHLPTFARKYHQLVLIDDYGNKNVDKWQSELRYFVDKVILQDEEIRDLVPRSSTCITSRIMATNERLALTLDCFICGDNWDVVLAAKNSNYIPSMGGVDFEKFVAGKLELAGFKVSHTPTSGDQGADLLAEQGSERIAVQCKRSGTPVGNKAVQEASAGRGFYGATAAWVVTDATFTNAARHLAERLNVRLLHYSEIGLAT